jgi:hypothetical protein
MFFSEEVLYTQHDSNMTWHQKLGHLNFSSLKLMPNLSDGIDESVSDCKTEEVCDVCVEAKQVCLPFKKERQRASRPLEIIHTDVYVDLLNQQLMIGKITL